MGVLMVTFCEFAINYKSQLKTPLIYLGKITKLIIGQLNINSLRNKYNLLTYQIKNNIFILMLTKTKLVESFPVG